MSFGDNYLICVCYYLLLYSNTLQTVATVTDIYDDISTFCAVYYLLVLIISVFDAFARYPRSPSQYYNDNILVNNVCLHNIL